MSGPAYFLGPTQAGKTIDMARWAAETGGLVVCATQEQADSVLKVAEGLGLEITHPVVAAPVEKDLCVLPHVDYDLPPWASKVAEYHAALFIEDFPI